MGEPLLVMVPEDWVRDNAALLIVARAAIAMALRTGHLPPDTQSVNEKALALLDARDTEPEH